MAPALLRIETVPPVPTLASTRFGRVWPGATFRFDAVGTAAPVGQIVRWVAAVGKTPVTLSMTASAPAGTVVAPPATCTVRVWLAPHGELWPPVPSRESSTRFGVIDV